ncbi:MAG: hypothetical protein K2J31_01650, partial [Alistipes sp.]|nr:hypothetical protein [Alistipes sp.]
VWSSALAILLVHYNSKKSFLRFHLRCFRFDRKIVVAILSIGLSPFLLNICASLVVRFVNTSLLKYGGTGAGDVISQAAFAGDAGDVYVGAYGIMNRVLLLFVMIVLGLNQGMQPIVGYNYGAKQYDRVIRALKYTITCAVGVMTVAFMIGQLFPEQVASAFVDASKGGADKAMIEVVSQGLRIVLLLYPAVGFQIVAGNFFQYIGRAPLAIFMSMTRQLLFLVPLLIFLPPRYGALGVWSTMPIADSLSIVIAATLLFFQIRKLRRAQRGQHFGKL